MDHVRRLVGRDDELQRLDLFVQGAASHGEALAMFGEPGVGKTALIEAATERAAELGLDVVQITGTEFESDISYAGLNQLLGPYIDRLDELMEVHRIALAVVLGLSDASPPQSLVLVSAVIALLRVIASRSSLVVVDDAQWIDRASASVLSLMSRRLSGSKIGLLTASRTGWQSHFDDRGLPGLAIESLEIDDAHQLVTDTFPSLAPYVRRRVLAEANGNPLALLELPRALSHLQWGGQAELPQNLPLTKRLEDLFGARILELEPPTRQLMLLIALEGVGNLRRLQSVVADDPLALLNPAERAGLLRIDFEGGRVDFRHSIIRSAVVQTSTSLDRRQAHRVLAAAVDDDPVRRAWHLAEATIGVDEEVALQLEVGSHLVLQRGDAVRAVQMLVRAAEFSAREADRSRRLAEAAYIGATRSDEVYDPHSLLQAAQTLPADRDTALLMAAAAGYLLLDSDVGVDTAHQLVLTAIQAHDTADTKLDGPMIAAVNVLRVSAAFGMRADLWAPFHELIQRATDVPLELQLADRFSADPARRALPALPQLDAAIAEVSDQTDSLAVIGLAGFASYVDRIPYLREPVTRVLREARAADAHREQTIALTSSLEGAWMSGNWQGLREIVREGLDVATTHGPRSLVWAFHFYSALLDGAAGDRVAVELKTDEIFRWSIPRKMGWPEAAGRHASGFCALSCRDYEEAFRQCAAVTSPGELRAHCPHALWVTLDLVESAVQTGRLTEAAHHVEACKALNLAAISSRQRLLTTTAEALIESGEAATLRFEEALKIEGVAEWPFDLARSRLLYGEHLRRLRANRDARTALSSALEVFEALGATAWAARANAELRATGINRPSRRQRPSHFELSPQEYEVASLAASGLTNKEIAQRLHMSPRTVGSHLYKIFPKLGIASRSALRDALAGREAPPEVLLDP